MNDFCSKHMDMVDKVSRVTQRLDDLPDVIAVKVSTKISDEMETRLGKQEDRLSKQISTQVGDVLKKNGNGNGHRCIKTRWGTIEGFGAAEVLVIMVGLAVAYLIVTKQYERKRDPERFRQAVIEAVRSEGLSENR